MERLLAGTFGENVPALVVADCVSVIVRGVLNAYDVPGTGTALESKLAGILRVADSFDQDMEAQPRPASFGQAGILALAGFATGCPTHAATNA